VYRASVLRRRGGRGDPLEALLGVLAEKALRCSIRLTVGKLSLEVRGTMAPAGRSGWRLGERQWARCSGRRVSAAAAPHGSLWRRPGMCGWLFRARPRLL